MDCYIFQSISQYQKWKQLLSYNFSIKYLNFIFINHSIQLKSQNIQLMEPAKLVRTMKLSNQQVELNTFNFKLGYGLVSTAPVQFIDGKTRYVVDMVTTAVIFNQVFETTLEVAQSFNRKEELVKNYEKYNESKGFGFLFGFFGMLGQNASYKIGSSNTSYAVYRSSYHRIKRLANSISSLRERKVRVIGDILVEGIGYVPAEQLLFMEILTVKGKNEHGDIVDLKVMNQDGVKVADKDGNVNGNVISGRLQIIPL